MSRDGGSSPLKTDDGPAGGICSAFAALRRSWTNGRTVERVGYAVGAVLMLSGLAHLVVFAIDGGPWEGPVSWRKAVTFGLSFGLTVLTVTWVSTFVRMGPRRRRWLVGLFTGACVVETTLVTLQAWRHVPSHFNQSSALNSTISTTLAAGGAVIVLTTILMTVAALRSNPEISPSLRLGVAAGYVIFVVALVIGAVMIAKGVTLQRTVSDQAAYNDAGSLKLAHATPMHGILVLPMAAWLLSFSRWSERTRLRIVWLAYASYALLVAVVIVETVAGYDPLRPPVLPGILSGLGLAALAAAGVLVLLGVTRYAARENPTDRAA